MTKSRVLFVLKDSTINGLTREVAYFVRSLPVEGWEPFVAVFRGRGLGDQLIGSSVGPPFSCNADRDGDEVASERLLGYVASVQPHVVYAYLDSVPALQRLASLRPRVLLVKAEGRKIMEGRAERRDLYRALGGVFDRVVVTSTSMRERLQEFESVSPKCLLLPSSVDTDLFVPCTDKERAKRALGLPQRPVCLNVARLVPHKRPGRFVRLAKLAGQLAQRQSRPTFVWVGGGEAISESRNARMLRSAGVRFVPTQADVRPYFDAADVFVMTSRAESAPNALLEAMSCSVPVVTTRCYESVEEVITAGTGFVSDDLRETADLLTKLLATPERRAVMGRIARQHVEAHYSITSRARLFSSEFSMAWN